MARISLKDLATLQSSLKLIDENIEAFKSKFKNDAKADAVKGTNPGIYGANESYVQINELGPVIDDLVDGVRILEDEMLEINKFLAEQIGRDADETILTGKIQALDRLGNLVTVFDVDSASEIDNISPASGTLNVAGNITLTGALSGGINGLQVGDLQLNQQDKIGFGGDSVNTFIAANTDSPEDLEIHADQDVILRPDGNVVVGTTAVMNANGVWIGPNSGLVGDKGQKGETGAQGAQGPQGPKGNTGSQGAQGAHGTSGTSGSSGSSGTSGIKGQKGQTGNTGPGGGTGAPGAKGATGAQGAQGARGAQGAVGPIIEDAVLEGSNLVLQHESLGPINVGNVKGATGATGATGAKGNTGSQGGQGAKGNTGSQGAQGATGAATVYTPAIFSIAANQAFTATGAILTNVLNVQSGTDISMSGGTITLATVGTYRMDYAITLRSYYANRACVGFVAKKYDRFGSNAVNIKGSQNTQYFRFNSYGEYNTLTASFYVVTTGASDQVKLTFLIKSGAADHRTISGSCGISVIRIK